MSQSLTQDTKTQTEQLRRVPRDDWQQLKRLRLVTTLLPAAGVFFFETVRHGLFEHSLPTVEGNIAAALLALALAFCFSEFILRTIDRLHKRSLEDQRELSALGAVVQERERLSRELHDGLAQVVSYLLLRLDTVEELIRSGQPAAAETELDKLRALSNDLYADVRESISGLRSRVVELGLRKVLEDYLEEFEERHGIETSLSCPLTLTIPPAVELQLFRIAQEALANVRKHSDSRHVEISIALPTAATVELKVSDDGRGFDEGAAEVSEKSSFGLTGMRERAEALSGTCEIDSTLGSGTRVIVRVPLVYANGTVAAAAR